MNVLIDTNVLLSAALRDRLPERVLMFVAMHDEWKWLVTEEIIDEYAGVIKRPKFKLSEELIQQWLNLISMRALNVANPPIAPAFPRDPKDLPFLAAAIFHQVDYLITGDKDLLDAKDAFETRILTVAEFAGEFQIS